MGALSVALDLMAVSVKSLDPHPPHLYHLFNGCNDNYEGPSGAP